MFKVAPPVTRRLQSEDGGHRKKAVKVRVASGFDRSGWFGLAGRYPFSLSLGGQVLYCSNQSLSTESAEKCAGYDQKVARKLLDVLEV